MENESVHIINRQTFELICPDMESAWPVQNKMNYVLQQKINQSINNICNKVCSGNSLLRIPLLEIDLGEIDLSGSEDEIINKFEKQFFEKIITQSGVAGNKNKKEVAFNQDQLDIITLFLLTGNIPWFVKKTKPDYISDIFAEILNSDPESFRLIILRNSLNEKFIERLIYQSGSKLLSRIFKLLEIDRNVVRQSELILNKIVADIVIKIQKKITNLEGIIDFDKVHQSEIERLKKIASFCNDYLSLNMQMTGEAVPTVLSLKLILKLISGQNQWNYFETFNNLVSQFKWNIAGTKESKLALESLLSNGEWMEALKLNSGYNEFKGKIIKIIGNDLKVEDDQLFLESVSSLPEMEMIELFKLTSEVKNKFESEREGCMAKSENEFNFDSSGKFYIANAGLVLIAHYLPEFFKELGLMSSGNYTDKNCQVKGVFLLHYLASGNNSAPEYTLQLNKILCGLDMNEPLPSQVDLLGNEMLEADQLLEAVIANWQKLGSTTIESFRDAFLNRDGLLFFKNNTWNLQVERMGYDVLLDNMPWSYKNIQLSWMENLITTEW